MASYGSPDKSQDKKGLPQNVPAPYGYPAAYATGLTGPQLTQAYAGYAAAAAAAQQYGYQQGPPPPYSVAVSQPNSVPTYAHYAHLGYPYAVPVHTQAGLAYPTTTYVVPAAYDAGARFDGMNRPTIPPPPPGVGPNAAQLAMMQGQGNVVLGQQKGSFLAGGSDGGYTFW